MKYGRHVHTQWTEVLSIPPLSERGGAPPSVGELGLSSDFAQSSVNFLSLFTTPIYLNYPHTRLCANFWAYFTIVFIRYFVQNKINKNIVSPPRPRLTLYLAHFRGYYRVPVLGEFRFEWIFLVNGLLVTRNLFAWILLKFYTSIDAVKLSALSVVRRPKNEVHTCSQ